MMDSQVTILWVQDSWMKVMQVRCLGADQRIFGSADDMEIDITITTR